MTVAERRHLVLTGFMGTGKSEVGAAVARELGRPFLDMDTVIEERAGCTIPQIFEQRGEEAFRRIETDLCRQLAKSSGQVIATGGGALIDPDNRAIMMANATVICLDAHAERILERIGNDPGRPMLWGDSREERLASLLDARRPAYGQIPWHIETSSLSIQQVVERVIRLYRSGPTAISVKTPTGRYPILQRPGAIKDLGSQLRALGIFGKVAVVSDENVWPHYGQSVLDSLEECGFAAAHMVLPAGEQHKNLATIERLYDHFIASELDRSGVVVAVGGGVITDMVGFAASTYMRGVPLVPVPTTLLSMVDASVGGKVAVDHPRGKNLIGAFVTPLCVLIDPHTLHTLPEVEHRSGLAEIIKAGIIADPELFASLEPDAPPQTMRCLIARALDVKVAVVEQDPYEHGRRAVLNLGHTFAHAFEVLANYALHHGLAVSVGMVAATYLAEDLGICTEETRGRIIATLQHHRLPTSHPGPTPEAVYAAMSTDKKRRGQSLRFILPRAIGDVVIERDIPREAVLRALERTT